MTVHLDHSDGSETTLRLSMTSIIATSVAIASAIIGGIIIWVYGIQCNLQAVQMQQRVDQTVITQMQVNSEKTSLLLEEIRNDYIRKDKKEKNGR